VFEGFTTLRVPNLLGDSFFSPAFSAIRETI
jgi:hypothetical protein